jgi:glycosyltransferase involved in cell wall biosynthesis
VRALHVSKSSEGAYWAVRQVAELVRGGIEVHVALPSASGGAIPAWQATGAILHFVDCSLPVRNPGRTGHTISAVRLLVGQVKPDIIHSHHVTTTLMLRLALGREHPVPRIFQVPGPLHLEHWYTRTVETSLAGANDFWVAGSQYIKHLYQRASVPATNLFMSYHSVDTSLFCVRRTGYLRAKLGIPEGAFVVGNINLIYPPKRYLGQTIGLKCHEDVIEAIRLVQLVRDDVWGILVGGTFGTNCEYEAKLRTLAQQKGAGRICTPGRFSSKEVGLSWPDFDCALHVPLSENCGGVVEPLLAGVPIVAGDIGGLPEVVMPGLTGKLVPIRRPDLLAEAVLGVLSNYEEHKRMALRGREVISVTFDPKRCANEILQIYRHILFNEPRPDEFSTKRSVAFHEPPEAMMAQAGA